MQVERGAFAVTATMLLVTGARAAGLAYGVDAGVGESDNITLAAGNRTSQTMAVADLDFAYKQKGSRLDSDVGGNLTYLDFLQNAYSREILGHFNGTERYALIPGSLTWALQENWGQAQVDPFGPTVPTNQENVNYLSTGPDWYARLGATTFVNASARYARADYSVTPIDSSRWLASIQAGHEISQLSAVSLNGSFERILYKDSRVNPDTNFSSAYARYELNGARTEVSVKAGVTRAAAAGQSSSGFLGELQVTRKLSPAAALSITAGRQLTNAGSSFNVLQNSNVAAIVSANNPINNAPAPLAASAYTANYAAAGWNYQRNRTTLAASARWEKDNYVNQPQFNGRREVLDVNLTRQLSHTLSAGLFGTLLRSRYDHDQFIVIDPGFVDVDKFYGFSLAFHKGRGLEVRVRIEHVSRSITAGAGSGYAENRAFLTVGYRPR